MTHQIPTTFSDPINAQILAVSEDRLHPVAPAPAVASPPTPPPTPTAPLAIPAGPAPPVGAVPPAAPPAAETVVLRQPTAYPPPKPEAAAAAQPAPKPAATRASTLTPPPEGRSEDELKRAELERLTTIAVNAFVENNYPKARKAAEKALLVDPENKKARELMKILGALG